MAYPTIVGIAHGTDVTTNATSISVRLPDGSSTVGRTLVVAVSKDGTGAVTWPAGWTVLNEGASPAGTPTAQAPFGPAYLSVRYRVVDGTESYPATGATITCSGASEEWGAHSVLLEGTAATWGDDWGDHWGGSSGAISPPEATAASDSGGSANPPSLTPSWGSAADLWMVFAVFDGEPSITGYPYLDNQTSDATVGATNAIAHAMCTKLATAASDDPGVFTHSPATWRAVTVACVGIASGEHNGADSLTINAGFTTVGRVTARGATSTTETFAVTTNGHGDTLGAPKYGESSLTITNSFTTQGAATKTASTDLGISANISTSGTTSAAGAAVSATFTFGVTTRALGQGEISLPPYDDDDLLLTPYTDGTLLITPYTDGALTLTEA